MSDQSEYKPPQSQGGEYYDQKPTYEPPPPPPPPPQPCPDPCGEKEELLAGPPKIIENCCPDPTHCCDDKRCCTWEEVEDACVRAASAAEALKDPNNTKKLWIKIECKCDPSDDKDCSCEDWDCGCFPPTCVPCDPCQGLTPGPNGGGEVSDDCTSENLRNQLDLLTRDITSQQGEKAALDVSMKANAEHAQALTDLIKSFDDIIKKYREQRYKLLCKEDCLKGFYRDVSALFKDKYSPAYAGQLANKINTELLNDELAKCCQKKLEGNLTKVTKYIWLQTQAEKDMKKADQAFAIIKDLPKWIEDKFKEIETIRDDIDKALNDPDPEKEKWAFYLFYWKFIPKLCKCFPFPFCCEKPKTPGDQQQTSQTPTEPMREQPPAQNDAQPTQPHLGCKPGDWHPSAITDDLLRELICCAWNSARDKKLAYQTAVKKVTDTNYNLDSIKKKVEANGKSLDERIKSGLGKVPKPAAPPPATPPTTAAPARRG